MHSSRQKSRFILSSGIKAVAFLLGILWLSTGCKKDSNDLDPSADVYVRAQIDGQSFSVTTVPNPNNTTGGSALFSKDENKLFIYGTSTEDLLAITVQDFPKKTGTFALGDADLNSVGSYTDNRNPQAPVLYLTQNGRTGSVVITGFDGSELRGTFVYTVYSNQQKKEIKITSGEFKVPYTEF